MVLQSENSFNELGNFVYAGVPIYHVTPVPANDDLAEDLSKEAAERRSLVFPQCTLGHLLRSMVTK